MSVNIKPHFVIILWLLYNFCFFHCTFWISYSLWVSRCIFFEFHILGTSDLGCNFGLFLVSCFDVTHTQRVTEDIFYTKNIPQTRLSRNKSRQPSVSPGTPPVTLSEERHCMLYTLISHWNTHVSSWFMSKYFIYCVCKLIFIHESYRLTRFIVSVCCWKQAFFIFSV